MKTYNEIIMMAAHMVIRDHENGLNSSRNVYQSVPVRVLATVCEVDDEKFIADVKNFIVTGQVSQ